MCILVMENLIYGRDVNSSFDLKGKLDGRYRERSDERRSTGLASGSGGSTTTTTAAGEKASCERGKDGVVLWDRNFIEMAGGIPLPLQESSMSLLLSAIANDTTFLASVQATERVWQRR